MGITLLKKNATPQVPIQPTDDPGINDSWNLFDQVGNTSLNLVHQGTITVPAKGGAATPLPLINAKMLVGLFFRVTQPYSDVIAASTDTGITALDPDYLAGQMDSVIVQFGGDTDDIMLGGRTLEAWTHEAYPGFTDDVSDGTLPGPNTTDAPVTLNGNLLQYGYIPVAATMEWPEGLVMMANKSTNVTVNTRWNPPADLLTIPTGHAVTWGVGQMDVWALYQDIPSDSAALPAHLLAFAHSLVEQTFPLTGQTTTINLGNGNFGDIMRIGAIIVDANGFRDADNANGVDQIQLYYDGNVAQMSIDADVLEYIRNLRGRRLQPDIGNQETGVGANGGDGIYFLPIDVGSGRNWIPADSTADLRLIIKCSATPNAGAQAKILVEQMTQLT